MANSFFDIRFEVTEIPSVFSQADQKIADLHREATTYKNVDWNKAIACLQEANQLMLENNDFQMIERWLRLPMFLQQAGRMVEAEQEFQKLIGIFKSSRDFAIIYDKMRLIYQREKRFDEAVVFGVMSKAYCMTATKNRIKYDEKLLQELLIEQKKYKHSVDAYEVFLKKERQVHIDYMFNQAKHIEHEIELSLEIQQSSLSSNISKLLVKAKKIDLLDTILNDFNQFSTDYLFKSCIVLGRKTARHLKVELSKKLQPGYRK